MAKSSKNNRPPWYIEPYPGESVSHYFGRYRRAEAISIGKPSTLSRAAGLGSILVAWEEFWFNPRPTQTQFEAMAKQTGLSVEAIEDLFPPVGERTVHRSTRFCAACYREAPYHQMAWQFQSTAGCDKHKLRLLSRCPGCDTKIPLPRDWVQGICKQCGMKFTSMVKRQKSY